MKGIFVRFLGNTGTCHQSSRKIKSFARNLSESEFLRYSDTRGSHTSITALSFAQDDG
jgi:hypothetical protein